MKDTTNLNVRVDKDLKRKADTLFKDLGLNMSIAINMFLIKCIETESIPFNIEKNNLKKKEDKKELVMN